MSTSERGAVVSFALHLLQRPAASLQSPPRVDRSVELATAASLRRSLSPTAPRLARSTSRLAHQQRTTRTRHADSLKVREDSGTDLLHSALDCDADRIPPPSVSSFTARKPATLRCQPRKSPSSDSRKSTKPTKPTLLRSSGQSRTKQSQSHPNLGRNCFITRKELISQSKTRRDGTASLNGITSSADRPRRRTMAGSTGVPSSFQR
jgi:hypothetical protein